jgi:hypothetical protein
MDLKTVFKLALEGAALGDLQFTLRIAEQRMQDYHLPERTVGIMREMRARELSLIGVKGTKAMQTESQRLIDRYRQSIPGYGDSRKRVGFPIGTRKDGSRKWVSHRTVLQQRLAPLSLLDVQAIIQPEPVAAPAPKAQKRVAVAKPTLVPAQPPPMPAKPLAPLSGCPVCRTSRVLAKTSDTSFECTNCGVFLQMNGHRKHHAPAA